MTNQRKAKEELTQSFVDKGIEFLINRDLKGANRFYCGEKSALYLKNGTLLLPEEINSMDEHSSIKVVLKKIKNADDFKEPFLDKTKTQVLPVRYAALANKNWTNDSFYAFDENNFLTDNLKNLLTIIQGHERLKRRLGLLESTTTWLAEDFSQKPNYIRANAAKEVMAWLKESRIAHATNIKANPDFLFQYKGILIKDIASYHFMILSDGTDEDLIKKYIHTRAVHNKLQTEKPQINGKGFDIDSIIIASPFSKQGRIYANDKKEIAGYTISHPETSDYCCNEEFIKTFYYARLAFYLHREKLPFVNVLLSEKIRRGNDRPLIIKKYFGPNGPGHRAYPLPITI